MLRLATSLLGIAVALAPAAGMAAEEGAPSGGPPPVTANRSEPAPVSAAPPIYQLPKVGKPRGRIGGGRRGPIGAQAELHVLVPEHVGQTASAQPSLYWYLAEAVAGEVASELTLIDVTSVDPLVDVRLPRPAKSGIQRVRLADLGVSYRQQLAALLEQVGLPAEAARRP